jgi:hypothetical protein
MNTGSYTPFFSSLSTVLPGYATGRPLGDPTVSYTSLVLAAAAGFDLLLSPLRQINGIASRPLACRWSSRRFVLSFT